MTTELSGVAVATGSAEELSGVAVTTGSADVTGKHMPGWLLGGAELTKQISHDVITDDHTNW